VGDFAPPGDHDLPTGQLSVVDIPGEVAVDASQPIGGEADLGRIDGLRDVHPPNLLADPTASAAGESGD
jgi:hypothetical protein